MLETNQLLQAAPEADEPLRIVYFGMTGAFSIPPLAALLDSKHYVTAVVVLAATGVVDIQRPDIIALKPRPTFGSLPVINPHLSRTIKERAWEHNIPVFEVAQLHSPATRALLQSLQPDVGCVACFARRLPPALLALPRYGFLNVHPSLLPAYRGPAPLFWALRDGAATGVTIHAMDAGIDTGDVLAQAVVRLPDGIDANQIDTSIAAVGGTLLLDVLQRLPRGTLARQPQPSIGTQAPWPRDHDFEISPSWPARRAYNFMCATAEWGRPYPLQIGAERLLLSSALAFTPDEQLEVPLERRGHTVRIQFADGVLDATAFEQMTVP